MRRGIWPPCRPRASPACCRWCSSAAACSDASRCRCRFSTTAASSPTPPTRGGRSSTAPSRRREREAARISSSATPRSCSRTSRPSATRSRCGCRSRSDPERQWAAARSQGPQPGAQGREEPARRSHTAAPSWWTTSTPCSPTTCATWARRSTPRRSSSKCCAPSPTPRGSSSCATPAGRWPASIVYWHRSMIEVPWASALRESNPLCANVLLYWHMLKFAVERGFTVFDFGRSTPNEGTFHFKRQWGAEPLELVWEYWNAAGAPPPNLNPKNPKFDLAIRVWQRLPVGVATAARPARGPEHSLGRCSPRCSWCRCSSSPTSSWAIRSCCGWSWRCAGRGRVRQRRHHADAELRDFGLQRGRRDPRPSSRTRWRSTTRPTGARSSSSPTAPTTAPTTSSREFADRGVRLLRQTERRGKTAGLNRSVPLLTGDIVVFSDANAMYEPRRAAEAGAQLRRSRGRMRHRRGALSGRPARRRPTPASGRTGTTRCS